MGIFAYEICRWTLRRRQAGLAPASALFVDEAPDLSRDMLGRGAIGEVGKTGAVRPHEIAEGAVVHQLVGAAIVRPFGLGLGVKDLVGAGHIPDLIRGSGQTDHARVNGAHMLGQHFGCIALGIDLPFSAMYL